MKPPGRGSWEAGVASSDSAARTGAGLHFERLCCKLPDLIFAATRLACWGSLKNLHFNDLRNVGFFDSLIFSYASIHAVNTFVKPAGGCVWGGGWWQKPNHTRGEIPPLLPALPSRCREERN